MLANGGTWEKPWNYLTTDKRDKQVLVAKEAKGIQLLKVASLFKLHLDVKSNKESENSHVPKHSLSAMIINTIRDARNHVLAWEQN